MSVLKFSRKKLNKKNIIKLIITILLTVALLTSIFLYIFNFNFRNFVDIKLLHKEISEKNLYSIELDPSFSGFSYAYDKYIVILDKGKLLTYNASASKVSENDINISFPCFTSNNRFLCVYENNGNSFYLISGTNILWQKSINGTISKINVNKNGYVSVIVTGTSYKSIVITFDSKGKELFKTYLSSTIAIDTEISNDNKYLSIAEVDYSGSLITSMIKTISIESAKTESSNSIISTHTDSSNELILNIKYQSKNNLVCLYDNSIKIININNNSSDEILNFSNYSFCDINLKNNALYTESKSASIFSSNTLVNIINIENKDINTYSFDKGIKDLYTNNEKIAINTGSEIHFIGTNGWLIKIYNSSSEINNIILGDSIAGIIYSDKIEIVNL